MELCYNCLDSRAVCNHEQFVINRFDWLDRPSSSNSRHAPRRMLLSHIFTLHDRGIHLQLHHQILNNSNQLIQWQKVQRYEKSSRQQQF